MQKKVLFHSFYQDDSFTSLKHALFYFGHVTIPDTSFLAIPEKREVLRDRYVQLIPDNVREHLEALRQQGIVDFVSPVHSAGTPAMVKLAEMIAEEGRAHGQRSYPPSDIAPVFRSLGLDSRPQNVAAANQITKILAGVCFESIALDGAVPCVDNRILFDEILLGFKGLFRSLLEDKAFSREELADLKAQFLAQQLWSIYFPCFEFRSFNDVLEMRSRLESNATLLQQRVLELGRNIEANPWDSGFRDEVQKVIKSEIVPQVRELEREAKLSVSKVAKQVAGAVCAFTLQAVVPDLISDVLFGVGVVSLREAIQKERERSRTVRLENSFGLLLEIKRG